MPENWWEDPDIKGFLDEASQAVPPLLDHCSVAASLLPSDGVPDAKIAVEIGYILLMNKPLILLVAPGTEVPTGLARAADEIVEFSGPNRDSVDRLQQAMSRIAAKREVDGG